MTDDLENTTTFGYLFPNLVKDADKHLPVDDPPTVVANLTALGEAMADVNPAFGEFGESNDSTIPAVYTYLGQFVDHDLTAATDRDNPDVGTVTDDNLHPADPDLIVQKLHNARFPALNLDSLYGDGPTFDPDDPTAAQDFYDGIKLKVGQVQKLGQNIAKKIPLEGDLDRDLPRTPTGATPAEKRVARIGDGRNDENLIIAQLHVAFLRFHNAVVAQVRAGSGPEATDEDVFTEAQRLVRWHYQWIVLHDYLPTIALPGVVDKVLSDPANLLVTAVGQRGDDEPTFMPLEFATAGFRFGHSMVRAVYDFNRNFGRGAAAGATFAQLFQFTGTGGFLPAATATKLPSNWIVEWDRFTEFDPRFPDRFSRRIDTNLADPLFDMKNQIAGIDPPPSPTVAHVLKHLAVRNLRRGYLLSLPTGQAVAAELGLDALTEDELLHDTTSKVAVALQKGGFLERTPLWFYLLKEAEVRAGGNSLGEVGSTIVAQTLVGQLRLDPGSYLNVQPGWVPEDGVRLSDGRGVRTIKDLFRVAGVFPVRP
ncbi:peroxidase family protein [Cryptosporangium phraense]|uniref:peroxidase family protein n=1 Tax=Cryptosporangium phraense TaxID=2593070 RepID=UPI0014785E35|nr:heme peroxidase family protein [Cryptosporangium phraense]